MVISTGSTDGAAFPDGDYFYTFTTYVITRSSQLRAPAQTFGADLLALGPVGPSMSAMWGRVSSSGLRVGVMRSFIGCGPVWAALESSRWKSRPRLFDVRLLAGRESYIPLRLDGRTLERAFVVARLQFNCIRNYSGVCGVAG